MSSESDTQPLAHCVYFTLNENTNEARQGLISACNEFLTDHPGTLFFGVGPRADSYQRPVNDQSFDVALVLVFATKADHDRYQVSDRHQQFLASQKDTWANVRVFDAFG